MSNFLKTRTVETFNKKKKPILVYGVYRSKSKNWSGFNPDFFLAFYEFALILTLYAEINGCQTYFNRHKCVQDILPIKI